MSKRKGVNTNFFKKHSPEMAYVLGFFIADGALTRNKRGGCYIAFQAKDKQIIIDIKKAMDSKHKISHRVNHKTGTVFYRLQVGSKAMYEDLVCLGFQGQKAKNLPNTSFSRKIFSNLVRGYFEGDGNVWCGIIHKNRKTIHKNILVAFTSASQSFLAYLKENLNEFIGTSGSLFRGKKDYWRLQYSKKDALKIYDFMYNTKEPFTFLKRKKDSFEKAISSLRP